MGLTVRNHQSCPDCGSSDALTVYTDGTHCYSCNKSRKVLMNNNVAPVQTQTKPYYNGVIGAITERGINKETMTLYGVRLVVQGTQIIEHQYPYYGEDGNELVGVKHRRVANKEFYVTGNLSKGTLFGRRLFSPDKHKVCIVTEGELDAMAAYQMLRGKAAAVSVKTGAAAARAEIQKSFEYLSAYDTIVLCFDNDDAGREAVANCADLFKVGQCKIMRMTGLKDACDYLANGKHQEFESLFLNAESYKPDGIVSINDFKGLLKKRKVEDVEFKEWPFSGLQNMTGGIRVGELVTVTAFTAIGKSALLKEVAHHILNSDDTTKVGLLFLEEKNDKTVTDLCSIRSGLPLHIHDVIKDVPDHELDSIEAGIFKDDRVHIFNHFGSNNIDNICSKIRYMAKGLGVKYVFLDHISILVSDQQHSDERKALDEAATKLKTLAIELNIAIIACCHLNREGKIRGSAAIEQLSDVVIKLFRDKLASSPDIANTTRVLVVKNRFSGKEGTACDLYFDCTKWRMRELDDLVEWDIVKAASESVV